MFCFRFDVVFSLGFVLTEGGCLMGVVCIVWLAVGVVRGFV